MTTRLVALTSAFATLLFLLIALAHFPGHDNGYVWLAVLAVIATTGLGATVLAFSGGGRDRTLVLLLVAPGFVVLLLIGLLAWFFSHLDFSGM